MSENNSTLFKEVLNPNSQEDLSYLRWAYSWGEENFDQANDVWANGESAFIVGTLNQNTPNPELILSRYSNGDWWWGEQNWNVTWTNGDPIHGTAVWGTSGNTSVYTAGKTPNDLILIKWNSNGTEIWNSSWNLAGNYGNVHAIWGIEDKIYMSGTYIDDLLLICWSEDGTQVWNKTWGGIGWEEGYDVWGIENDIYTVGSTSSFGMGLNDSVIVKWDSSGNQVWNKTWGNSTEEYFTSIFGINSSFYVCGNYWNETYTSSGITVLKYDFEGNVEWQEWWDGPGNESVSGIWANEFYVYLSASTDSWDAISDKLILLKWSYSGIYVDSSWPWWGDDRQYIPSGIFGWDYNIYICGWHNISQDTPDNYNQFIANFYSYHISPSPFFEPIEPSLSLNGTYNLTWQYFPEVESYRLYRDIHPILEVSGRTPYKILTNTSIIESGMGEGTYFYVVTSVVNGIESAISNPRVVQVDLPDLERKVPGYNIFLILAFLGFISFLMYRKVVTKN